ncbi:MAG: response regulator transcription factor [Rhodospirillales bacterium]|nr:response regulator transcription factor [Rhodospirillales bacterium]
MGSSGLNEPVVYVVDDDPAVLDSVRWLVESVDLKVETYPSGRDFLDSYQPHQPGCLIADVRMPGMSGLELQQELSARGYGIPVIIITGHGDLPMAIQAMKDGAYDFIQKPFGDQALIDTVQKAVEQNLATSKERLFLQDIQERLNKLTPREKEVLDQVVAGEPNKRIAGTLGVSEKTVEAHRSKVMEKMQAKSLANLIKMVVVVDTD